MTRPADNIVIAEYDPAWPQMFEEELKRLQEAIGEWTYAIEHVGSTSVPGLAAKPIIDIGIALNELVDALKCITPLETIGYYCRGEFGIPGRTYFRKATDDPSAGLLYNGVRRTHQIHMYHRDHEQFRWHIAFRDYMCSHPDAAREYEELKRELATRHGDSIDTYVEGKHNFIRDILRRAGALEAVS